MLCLIDSFDFIQWVSGPTHEKGHSLDLILSYGLSVSISEICATTCISDHLPVLFTLTLPCPVDKPSAPLCLRRAISPLTASQFRSTFNESCKFPIDKCGLSADEILNVFTSTCTEILDCIAPLSPIRPKACPQPWLNESTRTLRRACRRAERKWKKDRLTVSRQILHGCLSDYQRAVKAAKTAYFSTLVANNSHKPQVLFSVLNSLVNPSDVFPLVPTPTVCNDFLQFFISEVAALRLVCTSDRPSLDIAPALRSTTFDRFEPLTLCQLSDLVQHLRPTNCPSDMVPPVFLEKSLTQLELMFCC